MRTSVITIVDLELGQPHIIHHPFAARSAQQKECGAAAPLTRNHILSLVDLAQAQELDGEDWPAAAAKADALWRERGTQRDPLALAPIAARLRALNMERKARPCKTAR